MRKNDYDFSDYDKDLSMAYKICYACVVGIMICIVLALLTSCTTVRYVPVIENHTDTVLITKHQRDSIWLHDSTYIHEYIKGDTQFVELTRWHTKYIEKMIHDTSYVATHDTIPQPYEVPAKLNAWQQTKQSYGGWAMLLCLLLILYSLRRFIFRILP